MRLIKLAACIASATFIAACGNSEDVATNQQPASKINLEKATMVLETNADIAYAAYSDSVATAKALKEALTSLRNDPTEANLVAAKKAWLVAREPYGQTEVYRFRNSPIDSTDYKSEDGPEGDINAWPLGEALIDYVAFNDIDFTDAEVGLTEHGIKELPQALNSTSAKGNNIIENTQVSITPELLSATVSTEEERDVIAGYHAIEFLLWGQDLNSQGQPTVQTDRADAVKAYIDTHGGQRPVTDFQPGYAANDDYKADTLSHRRHKFMEIVVDKLIADLEQVQSGWAKGTAGNYRAQFTTVNSEADAKQKLTEILTGMGTLSEGELAGERMQIALNDNSQEDEHSCFSDNTHRDVWLNAEGVSNSYYGTYAGYDSTLDGTDNATENAVSGYGIGAYLKDVGLNDLAAKIEGKLTKTESLYTQIDAQARAGQPFDVLIGKGESDTILAPTIMALNSQAFAIQEAADALSLGTVVLDDASDCNTQNPQEDCTPEVATAQ